MKKRPLLDHLKRSLKDVSSVVSAFTSCSSAYVYQVHSPLHKQNVASSISEEWRTCYWRVFVEEFWQDVTDFTDCKTVVPSFVTARKSPEAVYKKHENRWNTFNQEDANYYKKFNTTSFWFHLNIYFHV